MRRCLVVVLLLPLAGCREEVCKTGSSPDTNAPERNTFASDDSQGQGLLPVPMVPAQPGVRRQGGPIAGPPFPAVVLVHGDYGLDGAVRQHTERLAAEGYVCLAVDLYRGEKIDKLIDAHILDRA